MIIDGKTMRTLPVPHTAVVHGDARCFSIACASIIAKVTRDRLMVDLHGSWPAYDFARHKGYITPEHTAALTRHGL